MAANLSFHHNLQEHVHQKDPDFKAKKIETIVAQWFPMCQFGFENYDTQIRVQIKIFYDVNHLQVFSSHCPNCKPFFAIFAIFVNFCLPVTL